jgi:hypothetical protein
MGGVALANHTPFPVSDVAIVPASWIPAWIEDLLPHVEDSLDAPLGVYLHLSGLVVETELIPRMVVFVNT